MTCLFSHLGLSQVIITPEALYHAVTGSIFFRDLFPGHSQFYSITMMHWKAGSGLGMIMFYVQLIWIFTCAIGCYFLVQFSDEKRLMTHHQSLQNIIEDQLSLAAIHFLRTHYQEAIDIYKKILLDNRYPNLKTSQYAYNIIWDAQLTCVLNLPHSTVCKWLTLTYKFILNCYQVLQLLWQVSNLAQLVTLSWRSYHTWSHVILLRIKL